MTSSLERHNYFDRGIRVCDRWASSFEAFAEDVGFPPDSGTRTLDRINPDGPYCKENCRWATNKTQCRNKRYHHLVALNGENIPLSVAAERLGLKANTLYYRIKRARLAVRKEVPADVGEHHAAMIKARTEGCTLAQIAKTYGSDTGSLSRFFSKRGVKPAKGLSAIEKRATKRAGWLAEQESGMTVTALARKYGMRVPWMSTNLTMARKDKAERALAA